MVKQWCSRRWLRLPPSSFWLLQHHAHGVTEVAGRLRDPPPQFQRPTGFEPRRTVFSAYQPTILMLLSEVRHELGSSCVAVRDHIFSATIASHQLSVRLSPLLHRSADKLGVSKTHGGSRASADKGSNSFLPLFIGAFHSLAHVHWQASHLYS